MQLLHGSMEEGRQTFLRVHNGADMVVKLGPVFFNDDRRWKCTFSNNKNNHHIDFCRTQVDSPVIN